MNILSVLNSLLQGRSQEAVVAQNKPFEIFCLIGKDGFPVLLKNGHQITENCVLSIKDLERNLHAARFFGISGLDLKFTEPPL